MTPNYSRDCRDAIAAAVRAEREACAKILDDECARVLSTQKPCATDDLMGQSINNNIRLIAVLLPDIADRIRDRKDADTHA